MGNTSSERSTLERQGGQKTPRRDSSGSSKDGDRPKILMDSPEDADLFHTCLLYTSDAADEHRDV